MSFAKHQFKFDNDRADAAYSLLHSESSFGKFDVNLADARNYTLKMKQSLADTRPSANSAIDALNVGNKVALKKMYSETAEDMMKTIHVKFGSTPQAPAIYNLYLSALQKAIVRAASEGKSSQQDIIPYLQNEIRIVDQFLTNPDGN